MDRAKHVQRLKKCFSVCHSMHDAQIDNTFPDFAPLAIGSETYTEMKHGPPTMEATNSFDMYVVDHIVRHINTKKGIHYINRWYRYTAADDKAKLSNNTPEHVIKRYWHARTANVAQSVNVSKTKRNA